MSRNLKVSGVAKGQFKDLCPHSIKKAIEEKLPIEYKIIRSVDLGKVTHTYDNDCKIIRYHYLNLLISDKEVMTVWRDKSRHQYMIPEEAKRFHKAYYKKHGKYLDNVKNVVGKVNGEIVLDMMALYNAANKYSLDDFNKITVEYDGKTLMAVNPIHE